MPSLIRSAGPCQQKWNSSSGMAACQAIQLKNERVSNSDGSSQEDPAFQRLPGGMHRFHQINVLAPAATVIQPKLKVNAPDDPYEKEADRIANQIINFSGNENERNSPLQEGGRTTGQYWRISRLSSNSLQENIQTKCEKCREEEEQVVQTKPLASPSQNSGADLPAEIQNTTDRGRPLDAGVRSFMENRFGADLGQVRVHTDNPAAKMCESIQAQAFTLGTDIFFNRGKFDTQSMMGKRLLAHELTHVFQQGGKRSMIQRTMTLTNPAGAPPMPPGFIGPPPTRALVFQNWLDELCSDGTFSVNPTSGAVTASNRATFCGTRRTRGRTHHSSSSTPTGCECLCEATATGAGSKTIEVQIDENITFTSGGATSVVPLTSTGGAATAHVGADDKVIASRGFGFATLRGAGDTSPRAAGGGVRNQSLRIPDWLAFGHELCGHALPQAGVTREEHFMTPQGNRSAIDIENRLRREHSTLTDSLGIRHGQFQALDAAGVLRRHQGSVYRAESGDTISGIAVKVGIPVADMLDHIWRFDGTRITAATQHTLAAGEELLIEGIDWHEVIAGENLSTIARIWGVSLQAMKRANPQVTGPSFIIRAGDRLLIPVR